jgi:hypothetical protein
MEPGRSLAELVIIGAVSGLVGALLTTLVRASHEREEAHRARLIAAADDLVTSILKATDALRPFLPGKPVPEDRAAASEEALRLADEAFARVARVQLLFGIESQAGQAAVRMIGGVQDAAFALDDPAAVDRGAGVAGDEMVNFSDLAYARFATPRWQQMWGRLWRKLPWVGSQ